MSVPYIPNPAKAGVRLYRETQPGVPDLSLPHDMEASGEGFKSAPSTLPRTFFDPRAEPPRPMLGKNTPKGELSIDALNPESFYLILAHCFQFGASPSIIVADKVFEHVMDRSQTDVDFRGSLAARVYRDDGVAQWYYGCYVSSVAITFKGKALVSAKATFIPERADYWDLATRTTGTGTDPIYVRGIAPQNFPRVSPQGDFTADASASFRAKVTAQDVGTGSLKIALGDATAFSGSAQVITRGIWTEVVDQNGAPIGFGVEVFIPETAVLVVNDVWNAPRRRSTRWAVSLPLSTAAVNEVTSRLTVNGRTMTINDGTLTVDIPTEAMATFGGLFPSRVRQRGQPTYKLAMNRETTDAEFRALLETGELFAFSILLRSSSLIADTVYPYSISFAAEDAQCEGETASVQDTKTYDEQITAQAYLPDSGPALVCTIVNSIPDLLAA